MTWPTSNPIARELDDFWKSSQALWQQWQFEADIDTKMLTGQQDYRSNSFNVNYRNQRMLMFNKILRIHNMLSGYQRDNRLSTVVIPSDNDLDNGETTDQLTTVINWMMNQDNTYDKISDAQDGANCCGLNLLSVWMDYRNDPENGEIKTDRLPFSSFIMSNYWTKQDLSDCDRIWTRKYITRAQLISLFPKIERDIPFLNKGYASKDGKFQFLAQNYYQYQEDLYAYDEYWVRDYRKARKVVDRQTGEIINWKGSKEQFQMFRKYNPNIELITMQVPTVKQYILCNNQLIFEEKSPYGLDNFPFVPFLAYHFTEVQNYAYRYQGIVRNIRDSQVELNVRRNRLLDIMDAQIQSGLMIKEDALVNPEDAFFQGPGKVLYFKQSSNLASDVMPIPAPPVAQGWMELIQSIEQEIMDIVGPEELFAENLGAKEMTGVLMKLKMGAGLTGLRNIFDKLNTSQKILGNLFLDLAINNFSDEKIQRIIGKELSPNIHMAELGKFYCAVEEGELTSSQRQLKFLQAVQLKQIIPDSIDDDYLLENSTLQGKKELIERAQAKQQQAEQMQQMQMQQAMKQEEMISRSYEAKAQNDFASAAERRTRAVANIGLDKERSAQADHDRAKTALDNARALHEIAELPEQRLMGLADFIMSMEERQQALAMGQETDSEQDADSVSREVDQTEQETAPQKQPQQEKQSSLQESLQ